MRKKFNTTGLCNPQMHYMADISKKIDSTIKLVEEGSYFTINRPHQYGKTTIQSNLADKLNEQNDYIALDISFEGIDYHIYQSIDEFIKAFLEKLAEGFESYSYDAYASFIYDNLNGISSFNLLSRFIGKLINEISQKLVLIIDEVDRSSNNQLFLDFLAMMRERYLKRSRRFDFPTFYSVILCGVYDIKKLKIKINPETKAKYNSPWNIAMDYNVDLSLNSIDIASMLQVYSDEKHISMDIPTISDKLFYYTSGYPFLVSYLCKIVDEEFLPQREDKDWTISDVDEAFKLILNKDTTNFQSIIKNLENNQELYQITFNIIMNGERVSFNKYNPVIDFGITCGIFREEAKKVKIHNKIYEHLLYDYIVSKTETASTYPSNDSIYVENGILDVKGMMLGFQAFMKEHYSDKNEAFLEKHGTLLFLAFVKPIINGQGFDFKEVQISEERRLDIVLTYLNQKYIVELKRWHSPKAHQTGLDQLSDYLDRQNLKEGYLLIYDFKTKSREYKHQQIQHKDKDIFAVWV